MELIHGHSICSGIVDGEIQIFRRRPKEAAAWTGVDSISILPAEEVLRQSGFREESLSADEEAERAVQAFDRVISDRRALFEQAKAEMGQRDAYLFQAHVLILEDGKLRREITDRIRSENCRAEYAVAMAFDKRIERLISRHDSLLEDRIEDLYDLKEAALSACANLQMTPSDYPESDHPMILVADELFPSDLVRLNKKNIRGILIQKGSATSHTAVLLRSLNLPAILADQEIDETWDGKQAVLDGARGWLCIEPSESLLFRTKARGERLQRIRSGRPKISETLPVLVCANIADPMEAKVALENGADGVGLFRSEFLYLNSETYPDEETQYLAYRRVLEEFRGRHVMIRTCDLGADKIPLYMQSETKENSALGLRGIRLFLERKDLFRVQLRALLRASVCGNLLIAFPMIVTESEVVSCRELIWECKKELEAEGIPYGDPDIGIVVETPAAVFSAEELAKECDFFSIGTNDLIQYTCAVDRADPRMDELARSALPVVCEEIRRTVEAGHRHGIAVGLCGEMAADASLSGLLVSLGIDELSVAPADIPGIKASVRRALEKEEQAADADA